MDALELLNLVSRKSFLSLLRKKVQERQDGKKIATEIPFLGFSGPLAA